MVVVATAAGIRISRACMRNEREKWLARYRKTLSRFGKAILTECRSN